MKWMGLSTPVLMVITGVFTELTVSGVCALSMIKTLALIVLPASTTGTSHENALLVEAYTSEQLVCNYNIGY